ncbi:MAG TPA: oligoribonuclease [Woeseiaceae bacterium]|nr:oligoribonuclease [Woeseiaceae bacterium]
MAGTAQKSEATTSTKLIWIDLEMTGLNTATDQIIEIATIVTDQHLNEIAEGPVLAIRQSEFTMSSMDEWNTRQHGASGLTARVLASTVSVAEAEAQTLRFLQGHVDKGASPMCGNSICQDRRFLARQMPELEAFFHYRNLDVTSVKILAERWAPAVAAAFRKESTHRALSDIRDSIAELAHYRSMLFNQDVIRQPA